MAEKQDAIALLKADHRAVEELFADFEKAGGDKRKQTLALDICKELTAIYDGKTRDTQIATNDGFIIMEMKRDSLGHIEVTAEGRRYGSPETHARLLFRIDQSYLPAAIASARRIFPFGPL